MHACCDGKEIARSCVGVEHLFLPGFQGRMVLNRGRGVSEVSGDGCFDCEQKWLLPMFSQKNFAPASCGEDEVSILSTQLVILRITYSGRQNCCVGSYQVVAAGLYYDV